MSDVSLPKMPLSDTRSRKDLMANVIQALLGEPLSRLCGCTTLSEKDLLYNMVLAAQAGGSGLPDQAGHAGQFLTTDGTTASWAAVASVTPGGAANTLQFNNAGAFGGASGWTTNGTLTITGAANTTLAIGGAAIGANAFAVTGASLFNSAVTNAANGAASIPAMSLTGTIFTGGSATTTKPQFLIEPTGTTSTGWSTSGTLLGLNAPNAFAGRIFDVQRNGVSSLRVLGSTGQLELAPYAGVMALGIDGNRLAVGVFGFYIGTDATIYFTDGGATGVPDLMLKRKAAATLQLGLDAAGVTDQMLTAANRITSDGDGAKLTVSAGNGRGGGGGILALGTYDPGAAGVAGVLRERMTFDTNGSIAFPVVAGLQPDMGLSSTDSLQVTINGANYKIHLTIVP